MTDITLTDKPLDPNACLAFVSHAGSGGQVVFTGSVRDQTKNKKVLRLEFEAYESMALSEMRKIAEAALIKFNVQRVSIHHRVGVLNIGELAVVIAVSGAHRNESFQACQYAIDTLKETVPIWKKEVFEDGEVWVSAHP